jgi:hypothetical protein
LKDLLQYDWTCLAMVERGESPASSSTAASRVRLEAMNFIVKRPQNKLAITGLGRDALMRQRYGLGLPAEPRAKRAAGVQA